MNMTRLVSKYFGLFLCLVTVLAVGMAGCGEPQPVQSDEDFLKSVQKEVAKAPPQEDGPGLIAPEAEAFASIRVETEFFDMGTIANDRIAKGSLVVSNAGKVPLHISSVNTSCGCTKGKMAQMTIPPGGKSVLNITVDPNRVPGFYSLKTLTIFSDDPKSNRVTIKVQARVEPEFRIEPEALDFGVVTKGEGAEREIHITQIQDSPFSITKISVPGNRGFFDATLKDVPESDWAAPGKREWVVLAKLSADAPTGAQRTQVIVETDIKRLRRAYVAVNAQVRGVYDLVPPVVTLRSVKPGETIKGAMQIIGQVPVEVVSLEAGNENLKVTQRPGTKPNTILIDVTIADAPKERLQRDTWEMKIKAGGREYSEKIRVLALIKQTVPDRTAADGREAGTKNFVDVSASGGPKVGDAAEPIGSGQFTGPSK